MSIIPTTMHPLGPESRRPALGATVPPLRKLKILILDSEGSHESFDKQLCVHVRVLSICHHYHMSSYDALIFNLNVIKNKNLIN